MIRPDGVLIGLALRFFAVALVAQEPPALQSPEVRSDRTVTFRLWAPKATEVQLSGDWMDGPAGLTRGASGVWTITQGPLQPNIYQYAFMVDGVRADDPSCRCTYAFGGGRGASNRFTIPGERPMPWDPQNQRPGTLHHERFYSSTLHRIAGMVVYTPAGFSSDTGRRYPVLVLLAGTPGDEREWTSGGGFAEIVLDNLIADGRMTPAIVVMHPSDVDQHARVRRGDDNLSQFERILVEEIVPTVRERYPVKVEAGSWAVAGLSLGGEFGMYVGLRHPELFGSIGSSSGSLIVGSDADEGLPSMDQRFGPALARPDVSSHYTSIWIGCGATDPVCRGSRAFAERLRAAKVGHTWHEYAGGHQMPVFRLELVDFLQTLFR